MTQLGSLFIIIPVFVLLVITYKLIRTGAISDYIGHVADSIKNKVLELLRKLQYCRDDARIE